MAKRGPKPKVSIVVAQVEQSNIQTCPACLGTKVYEQYAGLIQGPCPACNGTGFNPNFKQEHDGNTNENI